MKFVILFLAICTYASFTWAAARFFRVQDEGTKKGKRLISSAGLIAIAVSMFGMLRAENEISLNILLSISSFILSLLIFWWAIRTLLSRPLNFAFTNESPGTLVTKGPYQFLRHPFYTSYMLGWIGGVLGSANWFLIVIPVGMGVIYSRAANDEEKKFLEGNLRSQYQAYQARTWKFIPLVY